MKFIIKLYLNLLRVQYITSLKLYDIYGDYFIKSRDCEINEKMSETL